jgi:secondary thiamine-phosphate synthase enzyme
MKQHIDAITVKTDGQNLYNFTSTIENWISAKNLKTGILNLSILHTSASLIVQENADPDVMTDMKNFFNKLVPMDGKSYIHSAEGKDDMPAHIKSALTNSHLSLSVNKGQLVLGTWQGLYLFEHRIESHTRTVNLHYLGD